MRLRVVIAVVVALLAVSGVARAKGPSSATISGQGLAGTITVTDDDVAQLRDGAGYFAALFGQTPDPIMASAPTDDLGPSLTITWYEGTSISLRQQLYPYAATGPLVYTEPGDAARSGWYRAQTTITTLLTRVGVPDRVTLVPAVAVSASTTSAPSGSPAAVAAITVPLTAALLAMLVTGWRRRARVAPA